MTATRNTDPVVAERSALDPETARCAVDAADLRALLMMVYHHTGDSYWLTERFRPARDVRLIAPEDAGLPGEVQREIRDAATDVLCRVDPPAVSKPDDALFLRMMSFALNEDVPAEYVPMMREQMGFCSLLAPAESPRRAQDTALPVLVVGAGESGIALGAVLSDLGIEYQIIERAESSGGTWRDNIYPGCAVDTPNHAYSYSFGPHYGWTRFFSARAEIEDYLHTCSTAFGVEGKISFGTRCVSATWDDRSDLWQVIVESRGQRRLVQCRFLVSAIGPYGEPVIPAIRGIDTFVGDAFHSSRWPANLSVSGRSVSIIGTGASCMQIAPTIADDVTRLTVFQRTPQWVRPIPRFHDRIDKHVQTLLQSEHYYAAWYRFIMQWRYGDGLLPTLRKDPAWPHPERSVNKANDRHRQQMTEHIRAVLGARPDLLAKCVPSYPPYGKRILLDNGWYETLLKPNVDLVTDTIETIEPGGVRLGDGSLIDSDIIVFATGFDVSRSASRLNVRGRGGIGLDDRWAHGIGAYLGMVVPGFPNLFIMQGPTTGLAHGGSLILTSEMQARYIGIGVRQALDSGITSIDPKDDVYQRYIDRVDDEHERLVWTHPGMTPFYRNAFGKIRTVLPWRMVDYFHMTRTPDFNDFEITYADQCDEDGGEECA